MFVSSITPGNNSYSKTCSFKSVYSVYHWYKFNGKYKPSTDKQIITDCQRVLASILKREADLGLEREGKSFTLNLAKWFAGHDTDYAKGKYVRSLYNNRGGVKRRLHNGTYIIEPKVYIITGFDAIEFEREFGPPISTLINREASEKEIKEAREKAQAAFATKGLNFVRQKIEEASANDPSKPSEIHTIFSRPIESKPPRLIRIKFCRTGAPDNPLIRNGIL